MLNSMKQGAQPSARGSGGQVPGDVNANYSFVNKNYLQ
ncbi:hypothetical protein PSEUDO8AS_10501 [Pseudomonas sp. 8AS]|nr:hypothetical protein PSEUDO8AS_10501 [Pseudomonas sp. 8AS]